MNDTDTQQRAAVTTNSGRAMVIAGAGSGKTRVLTERVAYLIEKCKASPSEIMVMTFTRKAAGEMKTRLEQRVGSAAYGLSLGTMHALALRMINRFGEVIGMKSQRVTVYSQWEEDFLLRDVAKELGVYDGKKWKGITKAQVAEAFDAYYQRGIEPAPDEPVHDLFRGFIQRCRENNSLTYGGLMIGLRLLIPTLAKFLSIKYILVDEVQDIDPLQWEVILEMEKAFEAALFVVGDVDQSIFEWRGAAPKYLVDHQDKFDIYRLETNYRSVPDIVMAANRLIEHNRDRITKTMVATRDNGDPVSVIQDMDSERIMEYITSWGEPPEGFSIAVLGRNHFLLEKLSRLLDERQVKHEYIGKLTALTNSEPFRRYHAFLKLAVNPYDNFSFLLIKDALNLSRDDYTKIRIFAAETGKGHLPAFIILKGNRFVESGIDLSFLGEWTLAECCRWIDENFSSLSPEASAFIRNWTMDNPGEIKEYLDWLALYEIQDEIKKEASGLILMTIHAAKGLEWPVVVVAGCNEGIIPSKQCIEKGDIESERRLMYVAMTRARDQLTLTIRPECVEKDGHLYESPRSRFIKEAV